jgi:hypothetical protein
VANFMSQYVASCHKEFQRVTDSPGESVRQGCDKKSGAGAAVELIQGLVAAMSHPVSAREQKICLFRGAVLPHGRVSAHLPRVLTNNLRIVTARPRAGSGASGRLRRQIGYGESWC